MNILGLIDTDFYGNLFIDEVLVSNQSSKQIEEKRSQIGYVYQESLLFSHLNIRENLLFFTNDAKRIEELSKQLHVQHLLNKLPSNLSNGERQRISIIRSLLKDKKVILADEPTAALDQTSALSLVEVFTNLAKQGYIVIIATHDNVFDEKANEVIVIKERNLISDKCNIIIHKEKIQLTKSNINFARKKDFMYSRKRFKALGLVGTISLILLMLIIFCSVGIQLHAKASYAKHVRSLYPVHTYKDIDSKSNYLSELSGYKKYKNYVIYGNPSIAGLLAKKDSSFNIPGAILLGRFPKNKNEVLINYCNWKNVYNLDENIIGRKLHIAAFNQTFVVAGVITNDEDISRYAYGGNVLDDQSMQQEQPMVYVDYNLVENNSNKQLVNDAIIVSYPNLDNDTKIHDYVVNYRTSIWETLILEKTYTLEQFSKLTLFCIIVLMVIAFLFILNTIQFEFFIRKKEIGFMRLFGVKNKRIFRIVLFEYLIKVSIALTLSIIIFYVSANIIEQYININIALTPVELLIIVMFVLVYIFLLINIPFTKVKSKNILELIK